MAKISLSELRARRSTVDRAKLDETTDVQIEAYRAEDGYADLSVPDTAQVAESPRALRVRLGMTQPEMAAALSIPLGTWRNWEQGRVNLEPAAMALLRLVSRNPEMALDALSRPALQIQEGGGAVVVANLSVSEAPDVATFHGSWVELVQRITDAQRGRSYGEFETPRTRQFAKLLHDPEVRAWLDDRERSRATNLDG